MTKFSVCRDQLVLELVFLGVAKWLILSPSFFTKISGQRHTS